MSNDNATYRQLPLALLRILVGWHFLYEGLTKLMDPNWSAAGYCEGELRFGDKTYKVALFDDTCNGVFNDAFAVPKGYGRSGSVYARGDTMVIDIDGDGEFKKSYYDTPEMYHVGKYISFGDTCYELEIAPSGRTITVREAEDPCGYIASEQKGYSVELIGDDGALKLNGGAPRTKAPAGEYRFAACSLDKHPLT